jgi:hypothetical protein
MHTDLAGRGDQFAAKRGEVRPPQTQGHDQSATLPLSSFDKLGLQSRLRDIGRMEGSTAKATEAKETP